MMLRMRAITRVHNSRSPRPSAARRARLSARKEPRQDRSRAMVDAILSAAARVLTRVGYDDATTNRIAEAAGVSVGSLYQYFPNKEAIVGALIERHDDEMWAVFQREAAACLERPMAEAVPGVIDALFAAHAVAPALHRVLHEQVPRVGKLARLRETNARGRILVEQILHARRADHDLTDLATAGFVIVEAVEALIHQSLEVEVDGAAVRREATRMVLRYLGLAPASPALTRSRPR